MASSNGFTKRMSTTVALRVAAASSAGGYHAAEGEQGDGVALAAEQGLADGEGVATGVGGGGCFARGLIGWLVAAGGSCGTCWWGQPVRWPPHWLAGCLLTVVAAAVRSVSAGLAVVVVLLARLAGWLVAAWQWLRACCGEVGAYRFGRGLCLLACGLAGYRGGQQACE